MRLSTPKLALLTLTAAVLDLSLGATDAIGDEATVETPFPLVLSVDAFLTGQQLPSTGAVDGVEVGLERRATGHALVLTNPGPVARDVTFRVAGQLSSGSGIGRMGPVQQSLGSVDVSARIAAGQTVTRDLRWPEARASETTPDDPFQAFRYETIEVWVTAADDATARALLRMSLDAVAEAE